MKKYLAYIRCGFLEGCAYRSTFITGMLANFIQAVVLYYVWKSIFMYQEVVNGYTWEIMKQYVFVAFLCNSLLYGIRDEHSGTYRERRHHTGSSKAVILSGDALLPYAWDGGAGIRGDFRTDRDRLSGGEWSAVPGWDTDGAFPGFSSAWYGREILHPIHLFTALFLYG